METENETMIICHVCNQEFKEKSILTHLARNKKCKKMFGADKEAEIRAKRKKSRDQYTKEYYEKHCHQLRQRKNMNYAENPSPAKKKSKTYHSEQREKVHERKKVYWAENKENITKKFKSCRMRCNFLIFTELNLN